MKYTLAICICALMFTGCALIRPDSGHAICHVHKSPLRTDVVPVNYGLIRFPRYYTQARETIFPLANRVVFGGDVMPTKAPEEKELLYCPECRNAQEVFDNSILWIENEFREAGIRNSNNHKDDTPK